MINEAITSLDKNIFHLVNTSLRNEVFDRVFPLITKLGENKIIIIIIVLIFIFGKKKGKIISFLLSAAWVLSAISILALKHITHRPRPSFVYENVHLLGQPLASSFPSGHATLITAVCIILCFKYPRISPFFAVLIFLVGFSRIYVGLHYPTDVLGGFFLGSLVAFIVLYLEKISLENKSAA